MGIWRACDDKAFVLWEPHSAGPAGRSSPVGGAAVVVVSTVDQLAETFLHNVRTLARPGGNR